MNERCNDRTFSCDVPRKRCMKVHSSSLVLLFFQCEALAISNHHDYQSETGTSASSNLQRIEEIINICYVH